MAGIFALTTAPDFERRRAEADALAGHMILFPWQSATVLPLPESGLILGSVANNNASHPAEGFVHAEGSITCVVEGYLIRSLEDCGVGDDIAACRYARAAVTAYRKFGEDFPSKLEGAFTVLLHDADADLLVAGNGRFASSVLYHRAQDGELFYCTQLGPMAKCRYFEPRIDTKAAGHLLSNMQVFKDETVWEGVNALEPATIATHSLSSGETRRRIYWTFGSVGEHRHDLPYRRHLAEICDTISAAGERITSRPGRYISGLSGGLDSRLVAAVAARSKPEMKAWTFGSPGAPDLVVAAEIAEILNIEHLTFTTHPEQVPEMADLYSATVDGSISADFAYGVERTHALMEHGDIVFNGFAGEVILGGYLLGPKPNIVIQNLKARRLFGRGVVQPYLEWNRDEESVLGYVFAKAAQPTNLTPYLSHQPRPLRERIADDLRAMAADVPLLFRAEHYFLANRVSRWTLMSIVSDRHYYSDGSLFYDYEVLDRCMATPHAMRRENKLYADVFRTLVPDMGAVVNANNNLRADAPPWRSLLSKVTRGVGRRLRRQAMSTQVTGNDPNFWSREIYPDYYRELLADPRTKGRAFWDGAGLQDLLRRHLAGEVNAGAELGQLASFEFFCRRWVD